MGKSLGRVAEVRGALPVKGGGRTVVMEKGESSSSTPPGLGRYFGNGPATGKGLFITVFMEL